MEEAIELVFIPTPAMGHLVSAVGTAKLLLQRRRHHLSITVLIMKMPFAPDSKINAYIDTLLAEDDDSSGLKLVPLPEDVDALKAHADMASIISALYDSQKAKVRDSVNEIRRSACGRLAGFVVDTLCLPMMDVADEFGVPTYVFYSSGAAFLGLHLHLLSLRDDHGKDLTEEFNDSDSDLNISTYAKPFPAHLLPKALVLKTGGVMDTAKRIREAKGIILNTFLELETHALESLSRDNKVPPLFPSGPILNLNAENKGESEKQIMKWLDHQPATSVVFLCFGSGGTFPEPQVKEIAYALERSGQRFLWALRKPPSQTSPLNTTEYINPEEVLPEGFLERTKSIGKVIGWAPQAAVLAHPSVGGFVSHCGWNSILESIWFGVPMATWPLTSDQPANAFQLITEIGMAVEIIHSHSTMNFVGAQEIEIGINSLMDQLFTNSARIKAKELKEKSRKAIEEGGSSLNFVETFFENVIINLK